jgi:Family of unknown function (DUF6448)
MNTHRLHTRSTAFFALLTAAVLSSGPAMAHCDTLSGPVVEDARRALAEETVTPALKWIPAEDEAEVKRVFDLALAVRGEGEQAQEVADHYFFETLVRLHRASEGEGFTGLKPADTIDPGIAAADRALFEGNIDPLADEIAGAVREEIAQRFAEAYETRQLAEESVEQGREYVEAYVQLTHFVEGIHHAVSEGVDDLVPHGVDQQAGH